MRTLLRTPVCAAILAATFGAALLLPATGCAPLYGGKAERLRPVEKKRRPVEAASTGPTIVYDEECKADFFSTMKVPSPMPVQAESLVAAGNGAMDASRRAADPQTKVFSIIEAINKYKMALSKDQFNAEATMRLALAYDSVQKKGCALALLKRLSALQGYQPPNSDIARTKLDEISSSDSMFKGYRKDAMSAIGR